MTKNELLMGIKDLTVGELIELLPTFRQLVSSAEALVNVQDPRFNVYLRDYAEGYKIQTIKAIRNTDMSIGLKEAKDMTEGVLPVMIIQGVTSDQAKAIENIFVEAHARVNIEVA